MARDPIDGALNALMMADLDAFKVLGLLGLVTQKTVSIPGLVTCSFTAGNKAHSGLVTPKQRARIREVSGSSALVVEKRLLSLLKAARLPVAELVDILPTHVKAIGDGLAPHSVRLRRVTGA